MAATEPPSAMIGPNRLLGRPLLDATVHGVFVLWTIVPAVSEI